ncbi:diguanylate cyclase with PAS/PAC and GAF sensors [Candidatus Vecturithrix granuli]|uniref:Diguanylate cyclase with PAS/PAC and GAF sensors n=1 Tax=Vecturithrix granuli TaxID=1499967 RepID=A0A081C2S1_VECG1|nr:diguanylate cyclase with PAS/PAC and GAF sensors [Candidatus Vecturithrix granuli]
MLLELFFSQSLEGFFVMLLDKPVCWNEQVDKKQAIEYILMHQRIAKINNAMLVQYQVTEEQMLGLTPKDLFERGIILNQRGWYDLYEQGCWHFEIQHHKFDGTPMWIEGDYICIYNEAGDITGCFGIQRDVTRRKQIEQALRRSEDRFRQVIDSISDYIYVTEMPGQGKPVNIYHSPDIESLTGYSVEMFINDWDFWLTDVVHPDDRTAAVAQAERLARGIDSELEYRLVRADGQVIWIRDSGRVRCQEDGSKVVYGVMSNITERKRTEELLHYAIKEQEQRTRELYLLNHMGGLLQTCRIEKETYSVVINICRLLFPASSGCLYILNEQKSALQKVHSWGTVLAESKEQSVEDYARAYQQDQKYKDPAEPTSLSSTLAYFPEERLVYAAITTMGDLLGILCLSFSDPGSDYAEQNWKQEMEAKRMVIARITDHYALFLNNLRLRETLRVEAIRDPLTKLYNRRYMETSLQREIYRATRDQTPVGLLLLDIDHFKRFNDTYGHPVGDLLLQEMGNILQCSVRLEDIVCRYGGEEFLLILPGASLTITNNRATEILDKVRSFQFAYQEKFLHVTVSIGVAAIPDHGCELEKVIHAADTALYQAKANGRNQVSMASTSPLQPKLRS